MPIKPILGFKPGSSSSPSPPRRRKTARRWAVTPEVSNFALPEAALPVAQVRATGSSRLAGHVAPECEPLTVMHGKHYVRKPYYDDGWRIGGKNMWIEDKLERNWMTGILSEPLTQHTITQLYSYFLERQNIYPGLTATRSRQAHTTEQKVLSLGTLIDVFLVPFLLDNTHWDGHLVLDSAAFVGDLSAMPWLKGALQHVHFCDYAILAGIMQEVPDNEHYARNSRLFLEMTAHGNYETVAAALAPYLPFVCTWRDASASACMVVRLMEAFLAGSTLGKGRFAEYRPDMSPFQARLRTNLDRHPDLDLWVRFGTSTFRPMGALYWLIGGADPIRLVRFQPYEDMISRVSSFGRYLLVPLLRRELGDCHFPSSPLLGILVDGSKTLHAAGVFKPEVKTPFLDKDRGNALFYVGAERAQELQRFRAADDLRLQAN
eukprot:g880.t2